MEKFKKYICVKCGAEVTLNDIVNITAAKEFGYDCFNVCLSCYARLFNDLCRQQEQSKEVI